MGVLLASGCGAEAQRPAEGQSPAEHRSGSGGTLFFQSVRGQTITRVDLTTGRSKSVSLAELAPGDALFHLVRAKDRLVFYGGSVAYSLDLDLEGPPESLGESLYFVPSAVEGRVWLMLPDPASSETVRDLRGVQETTVDGRRAAARRSSQRSRTACSSSRQTSFASGIRAPEV